nr:hypothetical protein B0A51_17009 [Rachicladosporium sp. CCFEE 5018]
MDFAFKRQDETKAISSSTIKTVPLTCHGHSRPITHLTFSSELGSSSSAPQYYMISACKDNNPMLRDGLTGDWIGTFIGHKGAVWSARLSEDATLAATGSADFSAKIWDTFTGETLATLQHAHIVRAVAFPPGQRPTLCATGGMEKKLRVWDIERAVNATSDAATAPECPSFEIGAGDHTAAIKSVIWTRDPNILLTACEDAKLRFYDLRTSTLIHTFALACPPTSCELNSTLSGTSSDDAGTITVAAGNDIYFLSPTAPFTLLKHLSLDCDVASVALNGPARKFVTGSPSDTWVHVWDYDQEAEVETGRGHHGPVWTVGWSPDGRVYATGSEDGTVKMWKYGEGGYGLWR